MILTCHSCQRPLEFTPPLARSASCDQCHSDLRCCLNCRFATSSAHRGCREEQASWVKDKERANFCSYFSPSGQLKRDGEPGEAVKAGLAALFAPAPAAVSCGVGASSMAAELAAFLGAKR